MTAVDTATLQLYHSEKVRRCFLVLCEPQYNIFFQQNYTLILGAGEHLKSPRSRKMEENMYWGPLTATEVRSLSMSYQTHPLEPPCLC